MSERDRTIDKTHNQEVEQAVIAVLCMHGAKALDLMGDVEVDDFYNPKHQLYFIAARNLECSRTPIDPTTLDIELRRLGKAEAAESPHYPLQLILKHTCVVHTLATHVEELRNLRTSRELLQACDRIRIWATDGMTHGNALLDEALGEISRVALPTKTVADITIASVAAGQAERIAAWGSATAEERERLLPRIPWGIDTLDVETGGIPCGLVTVIGARPGIGKTTLLVNFALRTQEPGLIFTNEDDPDEDLGAAMLSWVARVDSRRIRDMSFTPIEQAQVLQAAAFLKTKPHVRFVRAGGMNIHQMRRIAVTDRQRRGTRWMWIDYVQNVPPSTKSRDGKRTYEIQEIMQTCQTFAGETGMAIGVNSQISRDVSKETERRADGKAKAGRPRMDHFRDSGAIEACGKLIVAMHRDPEKPNDVIEAVILKNRRGAAQTNRGPRTVDLQCLYEYSYLGDAAHAAPSWSSSSRFDNVPLPTER